MHLKPPITPRSFLIAAALLFAVAQVYGWLRLPLPDAKVVPRAELVVVATVKAGSVHCVMPSPPGELPENHLELEVSEFLKGTNVSRTIPVCVPWGLTPVVGGHYSNKFLTVDLREMWVLYYRTNYPQEVIEIFDTGNSLKSLRPFTGDVRTNHIWLLRHDPSYGYNCRSNMLSVYDPEDIQPLWKRADLERYLK